MEKHKQGRVDPVDIKVKRKLSEISKSLDPETIGPQEAQLLAEKVACQLADLPLEDAIIIRQRVGVAVSELETLVEELRDELSALGDTLKSVSQHSTVAAAYHRRFASRSR